VLVSAAFFLVTLLFHPRTGLLPQWLSSRGSDRRILRENTLKAAYQELEAMDFKQEIVPVSQLARRRRISMPQAYREVESLVTKKFATIHSPAGDASLSLQPVLLSLTPKGWETACRIVRNHRLWELYLTNEARYAPDHVHEDAEKIEHVLGEETVRRIERILSNPRRDPHGKLIPSQQDIDRGFVA